MDISYKKPSTFTLKRKKFNGHSDMTFKMHRSGLHYWEDLLAFCMLNTVEEYMQCFTKREIRDARRAVSLKAKVGFASDKDLIWALKTGAIKNCEVKPKDFENAIAIWGKNIAELKGKTVRKKPAPVVSNIMKVPRDLLKLEKDISLNLDIFFVNGSPFLITLSMRIYFTTVSNLKNQKLKTVVEILKHIYVYYFQRKFRITEFLLDPQFEAMAPLICDKIRAPRINVTAVSSTSHLWNDELRWLRNVAKPPVTACPFQGSQAS